MLIHDIVKSNLFYKVLNKISGIYEIPFSLYNLHFKAVSSELNSIFKSADVYRTTSNCVNYYFRIWFMWWQGFDNAPKVVKTNYKRLTRIFGQRVVFLSKDNIKDYTNIDQQLWNKLNEGIIDYTHWSDIVRFNVLLNNGGLWVDSTILLSPKVKEFVLSQSTHSFFSIRCDDYRYVSGGKWIIGFIGGMPGEQLFDYLNNFYQLYYANYSKLVDYLLTDFAISYYYETHLTFRNQVNNFSNEWYPYFFSEHYLDHDVSKYTKLFQYSQPYSIQIFRYKKITNYVGTLYGWMINGD